MRLLVLGGTAWVGRTVAETARDLGHQVVCLARGSASFPSGVEVVRGDRTTPSGYTGLTGSFDRVVDVARHPGQVRSAVAALRDRCGHYVFVSSGNVYADHGRRGATEDEPVRAPLADDVMPDMESYGEAKVACEQAVAQAFPTAHTLARAGLIGGPGDTSGRTAYWPWRFARNGDQPVLVPDDPGCSTQVIDVRDLATWLLTTPALGPYDLVGDVLALPAHLAAAQSAAGSTAPMVRMAPSVLHARDVSNWSGARSLPLWLDEEGWEGFAARSNEAAVRAGLVLRPLAETLVDTLAWAQTTDGTWDCGLTDEQEAELLA